MVENVQTGGAGQAGERPVVLVTGASAGLGEAVARRFAAGGFRIVAVARRQERLDQLAHDLAGQTDVATLATDISARGAGEQAVKLAMERFGRLDCLVNNAGSFNVALIHETDDAILDEEIDTNLKGPIRFCRAALGVMRAGSSIVNIGSTWGIVAGMTGGVYCTVKAGLIGLTQALAAEYGPRGIRTNLVAPGVIKTEMTRDFWEASAFQRLNHEMTPFDREGTGEDVANAVFFFASDQGSYVNGQTLALDGGFTTTKVLSPEALGATRVG